MQALWKPTPGGGMRLVDVLPDGNHDNMPDGNTTAKARSQAYRNVEHNVSDWCHKVPKTIGRFE